jgi:hypothetical protein
MGGCSIWGCTDLHSECPYTTISRGSCFLPYTANYNPKTANRFMRCHKCRNRGPYHPDPSGTHRRLGYGAQSRCKKLGKLFQTPHLMVLPLTPSSCNTPEISSGPWQLVSSLQAARLRMAEFTTRLLSTIGTQESSHRPSHAQAVTSGFTLQTTTSLIASDRRETAVLCCLRTAR